MELLKKYSKIKLIDSLMAFACVTLTITTIVLLFYREWLNAVMNAIWAVIAWRNHQLNVRFTTADEIIEMQGEIIHQITDAIEAGAEKAATENDIQKQ